MFEKIKAWIKRKRETAREQQAADRLIKHIEQALGNDNRAAAGNIVVKTWCLHGKTKEIQW